MANFTLTQEQYEALIELARRGATTQTKQLELDQWLKLIERSNGVTRDFIWVQWQELSAPLPSGTRFPEEWPERLRRTIELTTRRIARADVEQVLEQYANSPIEILVTPDPAGIVGWKSLDAYFIT